jgi:DNA polymerase-3 subunit delta'
MQFKHIIGQEEIKKRLIQSSKSGRISHAQLFVGGDGSGNLATAIAYAQYINCLSPLDTDSCGTCTSCVKYEKLAHPDLTFSYPVANKDSKRKWVAKDFIAEWRSALLENPYLEYDEWFKKLEIENKQGAISVGESAEVLKSIIYKRFEAKYKVVIMWHAEKLNVDAANKLLKFIEEPADNTLILLITDEAEGLLRTILSRTQQIRFNPIDSESLAAYINKKYRLGEEKSAQIAAFSNGDYNIAVRLAEEGGESDYFDLFKQWMRMCFAGKLPPLIDWIEVISGKDYGREYRKNFIEYCLRLLRESIISNYADDSLLRLSPGEEQFLTKFAPFIHTNNVLEMIALFNDAHYHIVRNANPKMVFFHLSTRVTKLLRTKNVNL